MPSEVPLAAYNRILLELDSSFIRRGRKRHIEVSRGSWKDGRQHIRERRRAYRQSVRLRALAMIGKGVVKCTNCGCDDVRMLEIHHINGGGRKERLKNPCAHTFVRGIVFGRRTIEDLGLLCRVCNSLHSLERQYGKLPYNVSYTSGGE